MAGPTLINKSWIRKSAKRLVGLNCTMDDLIKATDGYLSLNYDLVNTGDTATVSGQVSRSVERYYEPRREKLSSGYPTRSDTNRAVQSQKMVRGLRFRV